MPTPKQSGLAVAFALPDQACERWTPARKANIAAAIMHRRITVDAALRMYRLSEEELGSWLVGYERYGLTGLRVTKRPR